MEDTDNNKDVNIGTICKDLACLFGANVMALGGVGMTAIGGCGMYLYKIAENPDQSFLIAASGLTATGIGLTCAGVQYIKKAQENMRDDVINYWNERQAAKPVEDETYMPFIIDP